MGVFQGVGRVERGESGGICRTEGHLCGAHLGCTTISVEADYTDMLANGWRRVNQGA